ncbi:hypothetical protein CPC735_068090 [Coccidioides posadasii C735 delta SOWgp]|uniref:Uncharacterized protein n=1 Tax=Coccidioides posadasii (strain C735) TaxID=222929 RepID=C5P0B9_COCP7|nr:hypothetical protein CPC735_068090 [Coccidioides posadasii C735 delta SOWgp]EER29127.1 hypothetical protein CPC735_068090 [Coccidioides posadasii C735 delta SOWgp]|eukprot:XP_003071272.1 hypothetical protein CPC735_068090 [Coccidioides posadasii C735 delta SOWgp]
MMATERLDELDGVFDDHPSLSASLEDFEESSAPRTPLFGALPSQHSGFRSHDLSEKSDDGGGGDNDHDPAAGILDAASNLSDPWSPPGFSKRLFFHQKDDPLRHRSPESTSASAWYRHRPFMHNQPDLKPTVVNDSPARSRDVSPQYEDAPEKPLSPQRIEGDADDLVLPASIPLPVGTDSPLQGRSPSPDPKSKKVKEEDVGDDGGGRGSGDGHGGGDTECEDDDGNEHTDKQQPVHGSITNYIRFAVRAEVQHREPFVAFFNFVGRKLDDITRTKSSTILSIIVLLLSITFLRALFLPPLPLHIPDLVKLSAFARSFEPLIYYSENGVQQIGSLQETGVAVWDLGESVRGTNMTSAPIIVRELDELSESLKTLSVELTRFFANVDSDIDSILIVMEWAKRELESLSQHQTGSISSVLFENFHAFLSRMGALETIPLPPAGSANTSTSTSTTANTTPKNNGLPIPTRLGSIVTTLFGPTRFQRTQSTLSYAFTELVSVLEEAINTELTHSTALFALFESIDRQFLNLQRTVVRESDAQERAEGEMLSSLWTRVLGPNAAALRKYEKNKRLLGSVRQRTVANKHLLMDHRGKLLALKVNLEALRRKLVSPLLRRNDSLNLPRPGAPVVGAGAGGAGAGGVGSGGASNEGGVGSLPPASSMDVVVEGQIRGLEGAYTYLRTVRERQKSKLMEMVYGAGSRRSGGNILDSISGKVDEIEGR